MTAKQEPPRPPHRRWKKMGVELEGGWDTDYRAIAKAVPFAQGKTDGSVHVRAPYVGEITTRPHETLDKLCEEIKLLHPKYADVTCGFHIHASFSMRDYGALCDRLFWAYFRRRWREWGKEFEGRIPDYFWDRYEGKNPGERPYCKAEFKPEEQLVNHNDRYTQLNFTAFSKFQTVECRLLPMFPDPEVTVAATRNLSDIYDTYLNEYEWPVIEYRTPTPQADVHVEEFKGRVPDRSFLAEDTRGKHPRLRVGPAEGVAFMKYPRIPGGRYQTPEEVDDENP